jgi:hypothetical protein
MQTLSDTVSPPHALTQSHLWNAYIWKIGLANFKIDELIQVDLYIDFPYRHSNKMLVLDNALLSMAGNVLISDGVLALVNYADPWEMPGLCISCTLFRMRNNRSYDGTNKWSETTFYHQL